MRTVAKLSWLPLLLTFVLVMGCAGQSAPSGQTKESGEKPAPTVQKPAPLADKSTPTASTSSAPAQKASAERPAGSANLEQLAKAAQGEGTVTWWTSTEQAQIAPVAAKFNQRYPNIKIQPFAMHGEDVTDKLISEAQAKVYSADLVDVGSRDYPELSKRGLLLKRDWSAEFGIRKELIPPGGDAIVVYGNVVIPAYNTDLVSKADAPKNWDDLLDPKWKGKVAIDQDPKQWVTLVPAWGDAKVEEFLRKLAANQVMFRKGHTAMTQLLAAGEFPVAGELYIKNILPLQEKGAPIEWVRANPAGATMVQMAVAKNAVHSNAATLFLQWLVSPEGQVTYEEATWDSLPFPGTGSKLSQMMEREGIKLSVKDWSIMERENETSKRYAQILGLSK